MTTVHTSSPSRQPVLANEHGIALIATLLVLILMFLIGVAALTLTTMELQIASLSRTADAATTTAESCLGSSVRVIQETIEQSAIPSSVLDTASPVGPVPSARQTDLLQEILGQLDQDPDSVSGAGTAGPDLLYLVGGFTVTGDIDRLYGKMMAGGSAQFGGGTDGSSQMELYYRVSCRASWTSTGTIAQVSAVYVCTMDGGDSCRKVTL